MRFTDPPQEDGIASRNGHNSTNDNAIGSLRHHQRRPTYPFRKSHRSKPRRWPLVLRFIKGAVHGAIILPVLYHAVFTVLIICLDRYALASIGLPSTIIPSLSIVVGLILVFRNQTSYNRFWDGRNSLNTINTVIRNLTRTILTHSYNTSGPLTPAEKHDIERTIRVLIAISYAVKHYLRCEWSTTTAWSGIANGSGAGSSALTDNAGGIGSFSPEYESLLPAGLEGHEDEGLGLPLQLTFFVDGFIKRGSRRGWFEAPGASGLQAQLNTLTDAYGKMETIKLTPIPIAHLIHQKQVLALFCCVLPFAMVDELGWWSVPIVSLVTFTLYGIEGIGSQLEDPFGFDRNDIKMDAIVEDERVEIEAILAEWRKVTAASGAVDDDGVVDAGERNGGGEFEPKEMFIKDIPTVVVSNGR
ncbi:hypothetical protein AJ80_00694 [Polytolypa hystricis UAMH7299]|uniref:Uncharacterized protein n=1 Tax=Polytolypa hystricis (strain UAMH7299) TaxID=1447883 RepID=A0A2B7Z355_POLH7|nr:hypothetical protein AJ80_00694 [Polytolypa hystricis UAMH7299]